MLSHLLKKLVQKVMMSSAPGALEAEMNTAAVEDEDFRGQDSGGRTPEERTRAVISAMTPDEKLAYITGYRSLGIRALPRHGLPSVWMSDATSGIRSYGPATAFPSAVAMAASWDRDLVAEAADHIAETARAKGISILLGPGVNIARIPTCGRNFEYMGEDPFLAGEIASAYIRACSRRGVLCTVKHLAANNSDYDRHKVSSDMEERTLREIYLPAFEAAVTQGRTPGVMSAYNPVNGVWASENRRLLTEILREEWGFDGFVISDWNSLYSTAGPLKSGLDLEMPRARWLTPEKVTRAIAAGEAGEADVDAMAGRLMRTLFAAGVYDRPVRDPEAREFHESHEEAALRAARSGPVLLKNDRGTLPIPDGPGRRIVVCGPWAEETPTMGGGSCHIARTTGTIGLAEGLRRSVTDGTEIIVLPWTGRRPGAAARRLLADADAVVVTCGFNYLMESELYDRPWVLPRAQRRLIEAASELNPRTVAIITAGGGVETKSWRQGTGAVVHGLYLGQYVGLALAELLLGRVDFRGRLPFTMAEDWSDIAAVRDYPRNYWRTTMGRMAWGQGHPRRRRMRHWQYTEGLMVRDRHFGTAGLRPAIRLGHGLSYSRFTIGNLRLSAARIGPEESLSVTVTVTNTGERPGSEVVQIYVADPECRLQRPEKELKGFARAAPDPGQSEDVTITLPPRSFRYWDSDSGESGGWVSEAGEFRILAGRSSGDIAVSGTVVMADS